MLRGDEVGDAVRERVDVLDRGRRVERDPDVETAGAARHHERGEAELVQQVAQPPGSILHLLEVLGGGIEVEDHPVRVPEVVREHGQDVVLDAVLVRDVQQRVTVVDHGHHRRPLRGLERCALDEVREIVRCVLVEEALLVDPPVEAQHRERVVLHVREHHVADRVVVREHVELGVVVAREEDLVGTRDPDVVERHRPTLEPRQSRRALRRGAKA
jgi:hypothetical protein